MPKEIPTAIAVLPTCGKIYSHTSLMNKEGLEIRAMKVKELDIFNSQAYLKQGVVIDKIIKACLIDKAVPVDELISADKDSLMLSIRVLSYGKDFTQENIKCPNCDNEEKVYKFDLTKSSFDKLEINPIEPNTNIFEFTLPKSEKKIKWKLMTSTDEKDLEQTMESRTKKGLEENEISERLKRQIIAIENNRDPNAIAKYIEEEMEVFDAMELNDHIQKVVPKIKWTLPFTCPKCKETNEVAVMIIRSFFRHK